MIKRIVSFIVVILVSIVLLGLTLKGDVDPEDGNLLFQEAMDSRVTGPFESTGSTSRFVLTKAIVERGSFFLTESEARSAAPDLVRVDNKFISIFTPGISLFGVPFYMVGQIFGVPQIGTYLMTSVAGLLNLALIALLSRKLGASLLASLIAGFTFLFATNAFSYAHTFTQHHLSTASILLAVLIAFSRRNMLNNLLAGIVFGVSILFDIPNGFMLIPIMVYIGLSHITTKHVEKAYKVGINFAGIFLVIGTLLSLSIFGWYNFHTTGSPTLIGQNIGRTNYFDTPEKQADDARQLKEAIAKGAKFIPFNTRVQLESSYILLLSNQRGWVYYSPIILLGIVGFVIAYRSKTFKTKASIIMIVVGTNIVIYSMFGDPWGGWSFGARYLIPGAALMTVFLSVALTRFRRNVIFLVVFLSLFVYSTYVNNLGAFTTAAIPPKGEAEALATPLPYTYSYNQQLANIDRSGSLVYNIYLKQILPLTTLIYVTSSVVSVTVVLLLVLSFLEKQQKGENVYE